MSAALTLTRTTQNEHLPLFETVLGRLKDMIQARQHFPVATYRLQFNRFFSFRQGCEQIAYLNRLGISDMYASPYFRANPESLHGYDITNHNELNPTIGTEEDYNLMARTLHQHGMFQLLDTVPNHMGIGDPANTWWMDVLENGRAAMHAPYFDIDWRPLNNKLTDKVLLPVLGDQYGQVLEKKELQISFNPADGAFMLNYYDRVFPVNPSSYLQILEPMRETLAQELGEESEPFLEYQSILTSIGHLPSNHETEREKVVERNREKEVIKRRLAALCGSESRIGSAIEQSLNEINGQAGEVASFDRLDALMEEQAYRLSFWRVAAEEINYRRFFDVNELAAVRVDQPVVFEEIHRIIFRFLREGKLNGLRIDHVDGLLDPAAYFVNLQRSYFLELARLCLNEQNLEPEERAELENQLGEYFDQARADSNEEWLQRPLYVVVEKILGRGESLPSDWSVYGTTGYEFTNAVNDLFVEPANQKVFDEIYQSFIKDDTKFADLIYEKKKQIMRLSLASEISILTNLLNQVSLADRHYRDFTISSLRNAIREVIACFPVYRTYIIQDQLEVNKRDQAYIETAVNRAKKRNPAIDPSIFDFLRDVLLLHYPAGLDETARQTRYNFVLKFQQCTGPLMAKGLEDTSFYIYNRLISLNEVGGEPDHFGNTPGNFHRQQAERQRNWPFSLLTTSTHDTKRSEDVRARINVLSEIPKEWRLAVRSWARINNKYKKKIDGQAAPDRNEEYFLYQTLLGVWPFAPDNDPYQIGDQEYAQLIERVQAYMRKAMNEAKVNTSWVNPNEPYQEAVANFVAKILERDPANRFLSEFAALQKKTMYYGAFNSLSQVLIKLTSPGVPDLYQGTELWDLSLVDPDNRRVVDYDLRSRLLTQIQEIEPGNSAQISDLLENMNDGRIKLFVTTRLLQYRQANVELFQKGNYNGLEAQGSRADSVCAYSRQLGAQQIVVVAPRLLARYSKAGQVEPVLGSGWANTWLNLPGAKVGQTYRHILTGETFEIKEQAGTPALALDEVMATFPVALLERLNEAG